MEMKKFVVAMAAALLLASCGGGTTASSSSSSKVASSSSSSKVASSSSSSSTEDISFSQNTSSIAETMYNLQIVGDMSEGEPTWPSWTPTASTAEGDIGSKVHFTRESKMIWKLEGVTLGVTDQFKFTFDDTWKNDFGWKGLDTANATFPKDNLAAADATATDDTNILCNVAGTYNFYYHPFYVAEEGIGNKMVVELVTSK